ncbi:unnamed protein product [Lathyrus sativus]|nr:unnamed protein product [Lathyrus sativus]
MESNSRAFPTCFRHFQTKKGKDLLSSLALTAYKSLYRLGNNRYELTEIHNIQQHQKSVQKPKNRKNKELIILEAPPRIAIYHCETLIAITHKPPSKPSRRKPFLCRFALDHPHFAVSEAAINYHFRKPAKRPIFKTVSFDLLTFYSRFFLCRKRREIVGERNKREIHNKEEITEEVEAKKTKREKRREAEKK